MDRLRKRWGGTGAFACAVRVVVVRCVFLALGVESAAHAAIGIYQYAPEKHERFYSSASPARAFIGDPYDWSGVAVNYIPADPTTPGSTEQYHWVTMISPSYFVTAVHTGISYTTGEQITFHLDNDPNGPTETRTVSSNPADYIQVNGTDLLIGKLSTPVSSRVAKYPIANLPVGTASNKYELTYDNLPFHSFGLSNHYTWPEGLWNPDGQHPGPTCQRMGMNNIDPADVMSRGYFKYSYVPNGTPNQGPNECIGNGGDSGAPSFLIINGKPAVLGTHYMRETDTFLPALIPGIEAALAASAQANNLVSNGGFASDSNWSIWGGATRVTDSGNPSACVGFQWAGDGLQQTVSDITQGTQYQISVDARGWGKSWQLWNGSSMVDMGPAGGKLMCSVYANDLTSVQVFDLGSVAPSTGTLGDAAWQNETFMYTAIQDGNVYLKFWTDYYDYGVDWLGATEYGGSVAHGKILVDNVSMTAPEFITTAVPEPSTFTGLLVGLIALALRTRVRHRLMSLPLDAVD